MLSSDLTHFLIIYKQTLFNCSNIQLEQRIYFLHNPFFIHSAIRNATPLFNQAKQKFSISKPQLWLFDTFSTKKCSQVVWFYSTSSLYFYFLLNRLAIYFQSVILFMESQYSRFHGTSNRDDSRTPQWNSSVPVLYLKIGPVFLFMYNVFFHFVIYVSLGMRL